MSLSAIKSAGIPVETIALNSILSRIYDVELIEASPEGEEIRKFVVKTTAFSQLIAKAKLRVFTFAMRPVRFITSIDFQLIEKGMLYKTYLITFEAKLAQPMSIRRLNNQETE